MGQPTDETLRLLRMLDAAPLEESDMQRELDLAWAAGIFEGEGCFVHIKHPHKNRQQRRYLGMTVTMTDHDVLKRFVDIVGIGSMRGPLKKEKPHFKDSFRWCTSGHQALSLCSDPRFVRFLGKRRRARLYEILTDVRSQPPLLPRMEKITHCFSGHEYTEANTRWVKRKKCINGLGRKCMTCYENDRSERNRKAREKAAFLRKEHA